MIQFRINFFGNSQRWTFLNLILRLTGEWSSNSSQAQIGHSWALFESIFLLSPDFFADFIKQFLSSDISFASFWDFSFSLKNSFFNLVLWSFIFSILASFLAFALSALIWILPHSSVFVLRSFSNFLIRAQTGLPSMISHWLEDSLLLNDDSYFLVHLRGLCSCLGELVTGAQNLAELRTPFFFYVLNSIFLYRKIDA